MTTELQLPRRGILRPRTIAGSPNRQQSSSENKQQHAQKSNPSSSPSDHDRHLRASRRRKQIHSAIDPSTAPIIRTSNCDQRSHWLRRVPPSTFVSHFWQAATTYWREMLQPGRHPANRNTSIKRRQPSPTVLVMQQHEANRDVANQFPPNKRQQSSTTSKETIPSKLPEKP